MSRRKRTQAPLFSATPDPPGPHQRFAEAVQVRGGNVVEVKLDDQTSTLCLIPSKFKNTVWIRNGSVVLIEQTVPEGAGAAITGSVAMVLTDHHVKYYTRQGLLPECFQAKGVCVAAAAAAAMPVSESDSDSDEQPAIPRNTNHHRAIQATAIDGGSVETDSDED
jgi:probable RNA-binding protein EIF1AD